MKRFIGLLVLILCLSSGALAAEGDPLLNVDDLMRLQPSYTQFLWDLSNLLVERGLLQADEKEAWIQSQLGDYLSNGGYGSILTAFYPGVLSYIQEEDQVCTLEAELDLGTVVLQTMKKYSPMDSLSDGLMLQFSMNDPDGGPIEVRFELSVTDGVFYRWDAIAGSYASAGLSLSVEGETIFWACPVPVADTVAPVMQIGVYATDDDRYLGRILFQLEVENSSYLISQAGFNTEVEETESQQTWDTGVATDAEATEKPQQ
ncbi:MAG: hypothetical protein IJT77_00155 [Clostridia bacterium]|nr:hypothetical protein [Clostridia bacterium]